MAMIGYCHHNHIYSCHQYVFLSFTCFFVFTNNCILLDYVTAHGHPLLTQTWHGIGFICFICTQDCHHVTTTATNQAMMKGTTTTTTTTHTHIHHDTLSGTLAWFFHSFILSLYFQYFYSACKAAVSYIVALCEIRHYQYSHSNVSFMKFLKT